MDITYIHGLKISTIIGIFDWERENSQNLIIDLDIGTNFQPAIQSDDIKYCIDYTKVSEAIHELSSQHSYQLLESFAEQISQILLDTFGANWVKIKINKPLAIAEAQSIGVIIERGNFEQ